MSKLADDLCAEIRYQCEQAEHFKSLWMQANDENEKLKARIAELEAQLPAQPELEGMTVAGGKETTRQLGQLICEGYRKRIRIA